MPDGVANPIFSEIKAQAKNAKARIKKCYFTVYMYFCRNNHSALCCHMLQKPLTRRTMHPMRANIDIPEVLTKFCHLMRSSKFAGSYDIRPQFVASGSS